ncbi:iron-sulfur assembly protein 2 [Monosporozyma servazzii]
MSLLYTKSFVPQRFVLGRRFLSTAFKTSSIQKYRLVNPPYRQYSLKDTSNDVLVTPQKIWNKPENINMSISERACHRLNTIHDSTKEILQVKVESGGCHGYQYMLKLIPDMVDMSGWEQLEGRNPNQETTDKEEPDDFGDDDGIRPKDNVLYVLPDNKGKVLVDQISLKILNGTTLIYSTELIGSSFKIINGKLKSKCGCGSSFDLEE